MELGPNTIRRAISIVGITAHGHMEMVLGSNTEALRLLEKDRVIKPFTYKRVTPF
jgi:hypothetical protein